ncbi:MAG: sulfatase [Planctomycetota bacterium]
MGHRSMRTSSLGRTALLCLAMHLAACGKSAPDPAWVLLARDFRPADLVELARAFEVAAGRPGTEVGEEALGVYAQRRVRPADWRVEGEVLTHALPGGAFAHFARAARLETLLVPPPQPSRSAGELAPGEYRLADGVLRLRTRPEWAGPPDARLRARGESGRALEGGWQTRLGPHCALGIPVWSGASETCTFDLPPESELHFRFAFDAPAQGAALELELTLDGAPLFVETARLAPQEIRSYVVPLPPAARRGARLTFAFTGPPGKGVFFTPVVGPRVRGKPAQRPWGTPRPDIVLVLVDTLRADMLAAYGGDPALAPRLNEFAARTRLFAHARSNAAWTLPSIATLLTGVYPGRHGATDEDLSLPPEQATVVEALARAGYRTGAITDANFVSPMHGLDQGFEWFAEHYPPDWEHWEERARGTWNLAQTLAEAREFLAADDGRPTFLFLHTYRVHEPYRLGAEEDPRANRALLARAAALAGTPEPEVERGRAIMMPFMPELRAQYEDGVRDLDQKLGAFLAELEAEDWFAHGNLVLTSDHGEALGENHDFGHGNHLWETKLRVPLLLRGPGIVAGVVPHTATLVDLAPTLAELAGLERAPHWDGRSLLTLDGERPAFAWQLGSKSRQMALLEGTRKLITTPEKAPEACEEAFDLGTDPGEAHNLAGTERWPAELLGGHAEAIRAALVGPAAERLQHSPERQKELEDIGYGGAKDSQDAAPPASSPPR